MDSIPPYVNSCRYHLSIMSKPRDSKLKPHDSIRGTRHKITIFYNHQAKLWKLYVLTVRLQANELRIKNKTGLLQKAPLTPI